MSNTPEIIVEVIDTSTAKKYIKYTLFAVWVAALLSAALNIYKDKANADTPVEQPTETSALYVEPKDDFNRIASIIEGDG